MFHRNSVTVKSQANVKKRLIMKRNRFDFWIFGRLECQKNPTSQKTIHNHLQNCQKFFDHPFPFPKTYCQYNIVQ